MNSVSFFAYQSAAARRCGAPKLKLKCTRAPLSASQAVVFCSFTLYACRSRIFATSGNYCACKTQNDVCHSRCTAAAAFINKYIFRHHRIIECIESAGITDTLKHCVCVLSARRLTRMCFLRYCVTYFEILILSIVTSCTTFTNHWDTEVV